MLLFTTLSSHFRGKARSIRVKTNPSEGGKKESEGRKKESGGRKEESGWKKEKTEGKRCFHGDPRGYPRAMMTRSW